MQAEITQFNSQMSATLESAGLPEIGHFLPTCGLRPIRMARKSLDWLALFQS